MIKCTFRDLSKLRDVRGIPGPFTKLASADETRLSLVDRVRVSRFLKPLLAETAVFERDYMALLERYGTRRKDDPAIVFDIALEDDGKGGTQVNEKRRKEFIVEQEKLYEMECEIAILPLPRSIYEKLSLTAGDLLALEKFIELPTDE